LWSQFGDQKGHDFLDVPYYLILHSNQKLKQRWDTETHDFPSQTILSTMTETSKNILGPSSHVTDCEQIIKRDLSVAAPVF